MIVIVNDILADLKKILGACSLPVIYGKVTDAVQVLANTGEFDPLFGVVDICVRDGRLVTLPREIYTVLSVNMDGEPAIGRDINFQFHLNGPGDCTDTCKIGWRNYGVVPTYRPIQTPDKVVAFLTDQDDEGSELWVYGFDENNLKLTTELADGSVVDGYQVPTIFGYAVPDSTAPTVSRITRIRKATTVGTIRLSTYAADSSTGTQLGTFDYDENEPQYQQIRLEKNADWIRVAYKRRTYAVKSLQDQIPLPSPIAVKLMVHALKYYDEGNVAQAAGFEATARRLLSEAVRAQESPTQSPPQIHDVAFEQMQADYVD
jgi:hypothetical protein